MDSTSQIADSPTKSVALGTFVTYCMQTGGY